MIIKQPWEWPLLRQAGSHLADVIRIVKAAAQPGITTLELDALCEAEVRKRGCVPGFKGYHGYPYTICASRNDEVVHGFPSDKPLVEGDLISLDFGLVCNGYNADSAFTVYVGDQDPPEEVQKLLEGTRAALMAGVGATQPGATPSSIGAVIEAASLKYGLRSVENYGGHGIGRSLHEPPFIPNVHDHKSMDPEPYLAVGTCICIEPMLTLPTKTSKGTRVATVTLDDGWTVSSEDGSLAAHFEHMLLITDKGTEILTAGGWDYDAG